MTRKYKSIFEKLVEINPWHFIWIVFVAAQIITLCSNIVQSIIRWGYIWPELILIGIVDAGINTLIISPLAIYFLRHTHRIDEINKQLEAEISERKKVEEALRNSIEQLKKLETQLIQAQKLEAIGTLAGGIAHDFNNILSAIMTYSNLMLMKMPQDSNLKSYPENILKAGEKAANLVRDLLAFSRKQILNPVPLDLNRVIKSSQNLLKHLLTENIKFEIILCDEKLVVLADETQLEQVLINLTTNARDAMPNGGVFTIKTESVYLNDDLIDDSGLEKAGVYALLTVQDTGHGIDEFIRDRIFEPFFTTKEVGKGTGLGLATAYGIIKQHSGNILCSSSLGQGTEFRIYLPLIENIPLQEKKDIAFEFKTGNETILLAEDNDAVRESTKEILEAAGYRVIEAKDGDEAISKFLQNNGEDIKLLLFDIIMPQKNGRSAFEIIRHFKIDIKVLFISGHTNDIIHKKGVLEKNLPFIEKPFTAENLLSKIREILD